MLLGPSARAQQPPAQEEVLQGVLTAMWGDPQAGDPRPDVPRLLIYLTDASGAMTELDVAEQVLEPAGGLHALNGRLVVVTVARRAADAAGRSSPLETRVIRLAAPDEVPAALREAAQEPLTGAQPRAVILCRFSDSPGVTPNQPGYFTGLDERLGSGLEPLLGRSLVRQHQPGWHRRSSAGQQAAESPVVLRVRPTRRQHRQGRSWPGGQRLHGRGRCRCGTFRTSKRSI